tara:strand:- start:525 stop:1427 length:903 start_codon:yes stop_codon:yes gene_type:complete
MQEAIVATKLAAVRSMLYKIVHKRHAATHCVDFDNIWNLFYKVKHSGARAIRRLQQKEDGFTADCVLQKGTAANKHCIKFWLSINGLKIFLRSISTPRAHQVMQLLDEALARALKVGTAATTASVAATAQPKAKKQTTVQQSFAAVKHDAVLDQTNHTTKAAKSSTLAAPTAFEVQKQMIELTHLQRMKELEYLHAMNKFGLTQHDVATYVSRSMKHNDSEISIKSVCKDIGVTYRPELAATVGKEIAFRYRQKYGTEPSKRDAIVNGVAIKENAYSNKDRTIVEACIVDIMNVTLANIV